MAGLHPGVGHRIRRGPSKLYDEWLGYMGLTRRNSRSGTKKGTCVTRRNSRSGTNIKLVLKRLLDNKETKARYRLTSLVQNYDQWRDIVNRL